MGELLGDGASSNPLREQRIGAENDLGLPLSGHWGLLDGRENLFQDQRRGSWEVPSKNWTACSALRLGQNLRSHAGGRGKIHYYG